MLSVRVCASVQGCVESIKLIYWTLSSLGDGPEANAPVDDAAKHLIEATIDDVTLQLMSRTLILSNLATTLALAAGSNPLRPMRYLMNCILKIWETKLSDLVRPLRPLPLPLAPFGTAACLSTCRLPAGAVAEAMGVETVVHGHPIACRVRIVECSIAQRIRCCAAVLAVLCWRTERGALRRLLLRPLGMRMLMSPQHGHA